MSDKIVVYPKELKNFIKEVLCKIGLSYEDSEIIADSLVLANLRGIDSHGVVRLPSYVERVLKGLIKVNAKMRIVNDNGPIVVLDADNGFGQLAALKATEIAIERAKRYGIAIIGVKNANHFGMAAYYGLKIAKNNMIGIVLSNAPPAIAPWGGRKPLIGTNPICIAIPYGEKDPIIADMAMSIVARGKIRLAALKGEKIPEGWALDENGVPTTDPIKAIKGSLLPIGGPKGYCLAFMIDVLCGILTGSAFGWKLRTLNDMSGPCGTAFLIIAIDINKFRPYEEFLKDLNEYVKAIKNSPKRPNIKEIFLPGEIEIIKTKFRAEHGIPLDKGTINKLRNLAFKLKVPLPKFLQ